MTIYQPGEILLLTFPFTDQVGRKRRPALVLLDAGDEDLLMARITSNLVQTAFDVQLSEWQEAGPLVPSVVRLHKVATIEKGLVEQKSVGYPHRIACRYAAKFCRCQLTF